MSSTSTPKSLVRAVIASSLVSLSLVSACSTLSQPATPSASQGPPVSPERPITPQEKSSGSTGAASPQARASKSIQPSATKAPGPGKTVALTFDDGPSSYTPKVLKLLQAEGVTATFFTLGIEAERYPQYIQAEVAAGMSVQSHSTYHHDLTQYSAAATTADVQKSLGILKAQGVTATCLRPPYGATNSKVRQVLASQGLAQQLWNSDSQDWAKPGVAKILHNATVANPSAHAVVLFHDGGGERSETVAALPQVIKWYKSRGYTFVVAPACQK